MIGDQGEVKPQEVVAEDAARPHGCHALALVAAVVPLMLVEGAADACYHVLLAVIIHLAEHSSQAHVGEVSVHHDGALRSEALERLARCADLLLDSLQRLALRAVLAPCPWHVLL